MSPARGTRGRVVDSAGNPPSSAASIQIDSRYTSPFYYSLANFDADRAAGHVTWSTRATVRPTGQPEIAGYIDNLTDRRAGTVSIDLATTCGCALQSYIKPRVGGIEMKYRF